MSTATLQGYDKSHLRHGTDDFAIWQDVYECDEYRLPRLDGQSVLDVGAHVGSFAAKCFDEGATFVASVEPCTENQRVFVELHRERIASGQCVLLPFACSDKSGIATLHRCPIAGAYSGGTLVLHRTGGQQCRTVTLKSLTDLVEPNVVKLDCEGVEYKVLLSTQLPKCVNLLYVEFHETRLYREPYGAVIKLLRQSFSGEIIKEDTMYHLWRFSK